MKDRELLRLFIQNGWEVKRIKGNHHHLYKDGKRGTPAIRNNEMDPKLAKRWLLGEFPDVDGCNAQGDTIEEMLKDAKEALELHILSMLMDGETLNKPSYPKSIVVDEKSFVTIVSVDVDLAKNINQLKRH